MPPRPISCEQAMWSLIYHALVRPQGKAHLTPSSASAQIFMQRPNQVIYARLDAGYLGDALPG